MLISLYIFFSELKPFNFASYGQDCERCLQAKQQNLISWLHAIEVILHAKKKITKQLILSRLIYLK